MITATRRWFRRNRTNFVVGAGVIGAGYLAGQYVLGRIREASQRMTEDRASKENLRRRFEQNQEDCTYTVLALLPTIRDEIIGALPVEQITEQLQQERQERLKRLAVSEAPSSEYPSAPPSIVDDASTASFVHASQLVDDRPKRSKAQLWQDMKINSIARALSLLYTTALLTLLTRIQLNLLGRRTYLSSVVSMASPAPTGTSIISLEDHDGSFDTVYGNDFETNRMYLTFSWWLLHRGAKSILERVMLAVKDVFGQVNIREDMSLERLSELIIEVRRRVEGATEEERRKKSWLEHLLPPREQEVFVIHQAGLSDGSGSVSPEPGNDPLDVHTVTPSLRRLLDETADLIDSPTFAMVLSHLLDAGFSHLVDVRIASEAFKTALAPEGARITEITDMKCKLAHILPVFCRQAHSIVVGSGELDAIAGVMEAQAVPNEYLNLMNQVHDLEAFAAVIYSSNFEYEVVDSPKAETASLQASIISMRDFTLDESSSLGQAKQFVEQKLGQTQDLAQQKLFEARQSAQRTYTEAREYSAQKYEQAAETAQKAYGQAFDAAQRTYEQARETATQAAQKTAGVVQQTAQQVSEGATQAVHSGKETAQQTSQQVSDSVQQAAQSAKQTVQQTSQQAQEKAQQVLQDAKDVTQQSAHQVAEASKQTAQKAAETSKQAAEQVVEASKQTAQQAADVTKQTAQQIGEASQQTVQQVKDTTQHTYVQARKSTQATAKAVQDATQQKYEETVKPAIASVKELATPREETAIEKAVQSNTLDQSVDLTQAIVPVDISESMIDHSSTNLSESAVVVEQPASTLSQSAVMVNTPGTLSQSTTGEPVQADFEAAWAAAKRRADEPKPSKSTS